MENPAPASAKQLTPKTTTDLFVIEDLLDFPTDDMVPAVDAPFPAENLTDSNSHSYSYSNSISNSNSNSSAVVDCCSNSSLSHSAAAADNSVPARRSFTDAHFSTDISVPVPYDDLAELEWLSNVVEESFSCEDLQKLQLISGIKARPSNNQPDEVEEAANNTIYKTDMSVPGKARTKRSRAAPCDWTSRLLVVSPTASGPTMSSESNSDIGSSSIGKKALKSPTKKKEIYNNNRASSGDGRKCLHCSTDKTPQWRSGPMGPKTLCNACGVRYKSGRLVPEYRPAASPTFVLAKHSNSHRKVLELRRQKEMQKLQHQQQQYIRH